MNNNVIGWAALSAVSNRYIYRGIAESSIYVVKGCIGQGIGKKLLEKHIDESENNEIWTIRAGIFPENKLSIALVKRFGFREIGIFERVKNE